MVSEEALINRNLYSKLENPELVTQNRKQKHLGTKGLINSLEKKRRVKYTSGLIQKYCQKGKNGRKTQHVIKYREKYKKE